MNIVQTVEPATIDSSADAPAGGRRERTRAAKREQYLRTAMQLVSEGGLEALTMQKLADDLDAAVGTVYTYFPSKVALMAELQRASTDKLIASYTALRVRVDPVIDARVDDPAEAALTRLLLSLRFWVATGEVFPEEAALFRSLITWPGQMPDEDLARVLPSAWQLFSMGAATMQDAIDAGAISPASATDRTVTAVSALGGVMTVSSLARFEQTLFDGVRLARTLVDDLVRGWGAPPELLAKASVLADDLAVEGPLAPPVPEGTASF